MHGAWGLRMVETIKRFVKEQLIETANLED